MTKLTVFEEREEQRLQPAIQFAKKDYVAMRALVAVIAGTIFYGAVFAGICAWLLVMVVDNIRIEDILTALLVGVLVYAIFIFIQITGARRRARKEYDESKEKLTELRRGYRTLSAMYEEEERDRSPERLQSMIQNDSIY